MGLQTVKKTGTKGYSMPVLSIILEILAMIIPLLVLATEVANDLYYYGAALISLGLILVTFYSIVKKHNELVSSKIPQLEKRGGDESE